MTPYEMAKMIHKDLSPFAPKLSAALNRALIDIGEGSVLWASEKERTNMTMSRFRRLNKSTSGKMIRPTYSQSFQA